MSVHPGEDLPVPLPDAPEIHVVPEWLFYLFIAPYTGLVRVRSERTTGPDSIKAMVRGKCSGHHKATVAAQVYNGIPKITLNGNVNASDMPIYSDGFASGIA
jgi:hypothetical protein